jgi:hypothetical protein
MQNYDFNTCRQYYLWADAYIPEISKQKEVVTAVNCLFILVGLDVKERRGLLEQSVKRGNLY